MPICKKCSNAFPYQIILEGKARNLKNRRYCLDCSPFGSRGTLVRNKAQFPRLQNSQHVHKHRIKRKLQATQYLGGKCKICGYNKCSDALEFHHVNPLDKSFSIGSSSVGFNKLKIELDKCVLLCSNCHRELTAGIISLL